MEEELLNLFGSAKGATSGKGSDDDVPANLSEGEYVIPADVVAIIGEGNNSAGADTLDKIVAFLREDAKANSPSGEPPRRT